MNVFDLPDPKRPPPETTPSSSPAPRRTAPGARPVIDCVVLFAVSLLSSPFLYHSDTKGYFVPWMLASRGLYPWRIYTASPTVNYPPICLIVLTGVERARLILHAAPYGRLTVVLLKIPFMLAHSLGVLVCYYGLRRLWGHGNARRIALMYALCAPLYVNAALWGQTDALLTLAMVLSLVLLANDRPIGAGVAMGWALTIKAQAVVLAPVLLIYTLRRFGLQRTVQGALAGFATVFVVCLPFFLAGYGTETFASYAHAVGFYTYRSLDAMNLWSILNVIDIQWRLLPESAVNSDARTVFGTVTCLGAGLLLSALYTVFVVRTVWRRPSVDSLFFGAAMSAFGVFFLATEMHERYLVPAAALLALPAVLSRQRLSLYIGVCATAGLNQLLLLERDMLNFASQDSSFVSLVWSTLYLPGALLNGALFAFGTWLFIGTTSVPAPDLPEAPLSCSPRASRVAIPPTVQASSRRRSLLL
jgi:Gpi18-like mannosyltransferase